MEKVENVKQITFKINLFKITVSNSDFTKKLMCKANTTYKKRTSKTPLITLILLFEERNDIVK